ncbi:MAG: bifunctional 5,10-methylenetetrahydrofolate dehydrogenase/5,10-methenyltetrahydrofolate cyclohydrolase [Candidatus Bathyarchaeia archaeon]
MSAKKIFRETKRRVRAEVKRLEEEGITPGFEAILVTDEPTSLMYAELKKKDCEGVGIYAEICRLYEIYPQGRLNEGLFTEIERASRRDDITGVLIQMPLPSYIDKYKALEKLMPEKDVDGLTPYNKGILMSDYNLNTDLLPCTPVGIIELLDYYGVDVKGMDAAIVGRSELVGKPLRKLLEDRNATVTCCHTRTKEKTKMRLLKNADLVVCAAGRPPEIYKEDWFRLEAGMIKEGAVIIGVGVKKDAETGKLYFDLPKGKKFTELKEKASHITTNLGGVGLMTRGRVLKNIIIATELCRKHLIHLY